MDNSAPPRDLKNAAWVIIPTRLTAAALLDFCTDIERVFRLNPYLKIIKWDASTAENVVAEWENYSNEQAIKIATQVKVEQLPNELQLSYAAGIKRKTYFIIEQADRGATLKIMDDYGDSDQRDIGQVDKSLQVWGKALEKFFAAYRIMRHVPWADKIINRWWIRLSPGGRRICYILLVITAVELIALLLFAVLYLWL